MILKEKDMKKLFRTGLMTALTVILATGWCYGTTIMFPYINSNPGNLSTIVTVINTANATKAECNSSEDLQLHYRYITKKISDSAADVCQERDFWRPTTLADLVTFDVAGDINGGEAMFGDPTDYDDGMNAPGFDLPNMGFTEPRRGYLLVNHRCSVSGEKPDSSTSNDEIYLDGEAMLLDVVNGAAWGYRAILADQSVDDIGDYAFASSSAGDENPVTGATTELLSEAPKLTENQQVALYPPDEFQTRFFVTPLVINSANATSNDMSEVMPFKNQKRTKITLLDSVGNMGIMDRDENSGSGAAAVHVCCVGAIDLETLMGGSFGSGFDAQGGWAYVDLMDPPAAYSGGTVDTTADHCAIVFKLQFGSPSFASGMINSCEIIRSYRILSAGD